MAKDLLELLIVDGHDQVRGALARLLQRLSGIRVLAAANDLDTAERLVRDLAPDAVLLEPRTVGVHPLGAVHRLVRLGPPMVILTSSLVHGEAETFLQAGAVAALLKGGDLPGLLRSIEAASAPMPRGRRAAGVSSGTA